VSPPSRAQRLWRGFALVFRLAGETTRDPSRRRTYLRTLAAQVTVTVGIALAIGFAVYLAIAAFVDRTGAAYTVDETGIRLTTSARVDDTGDIRLDQAPADGSRAFAPSGITLALIVANLALLGLWIGEALVILFSNEHHDQIGRRASLARGLEPEDPEAVPHIRARWKWLANKWRRKRRAARLYTVGVPLLLVTRLVPLGVGRVLYALAVAVWSFHWLVIFVAAKSKQAWLDEHTAPLWLPLRRWDEARARTRLLRWFLPDAYRWLLGRATDDMRSPCLRAFETPWEFVGLALARMLLGAPGVYLVFRPFFPVAASELLLAQRAPAPDAQRRRAF
jgi:hypothetical protein